MNETDKRQRMSPGDFKTLTFEFNVPEAMVASSVIGKYVKEQICANVVK
jgi:hypothetical protein